MVGPDRQKWLCQGVRKGGEKSKYLYKNRDWREAHWLAYPPEVLGVGKGRIGLGSRSSWQYPCYETQGSFPLSFFYAINI